MSETPAGDPSVRKVPWDRTAVVRILVPCPAAPGSEILGYVGNGNVGVKRCLKASKV